MEELTYYDLDTFINSFKSLGSIEDPFEVNLRLIRARFSVDSVSIRDGFRREGPTTKIFPERGVWG